jgi:long-chain acyl-CoA synthetase
MATSKATYPPRPEDLPLARLTHWERTRRHQVHLTQPFGGGVVRDYTWGHVMGEVRRIAAHLKAQGWPAGSTVAVLGKNSAHWLMADYAIWMAGYVSVPIYPTLTAESVRQILTHSEAKACFIGKLDGFEAMRAGVPEALHTIALPLAPDAARSMASAQWDDLVAATAPLEGEVKRDGDELATIIYTSGTTGMPKGVMHSFNGMTWASKSLEERYGVFAEDRMLSYLPLAHVAERWVVEMGVLNGGFRLFFVETLDTFAADLQRARPTQFISVPRLWVKFQQGVLAKLPQKKLDVLLSIPVIGGLVKKKILKGLGLDQARFAGGGASPMPPSMLQWFNRLGLELLEGYGMTENFGCSHSNLPGQGKPGSVGVPYPGVEQRISAIGELEMRSPALMLGYFKEPEKTRATMTDDGWLKTGDKGEIDSEGRLRITGRVKDLFKTSKGKYVSPAPIEDKLVAHAKVEACCVAGADFGQPFGIVMLSAEAASHLSDAAEKAELQRSLAEHLSRINAALDPHEQMDFLAAVTEQWTVEAGFITPTMKVKRDAIERRYGPHFEAWAKQKAEVVFHA